MKIDILSDTHFDFYFDSSYSELNESRAHMILDSMFANNKAPFSSEVLIIAGDLGHHNFQNIQLLKFIQKNYYKHIICVLGNHDYYLVNNIQIDDYGDSFARVEEMRDLINNEPNMYCLDGNVIEINGIKFGGCDSWYDGTYVPKYWNNQPIPNVNHWRNCMNDGVYIYGLKDYKDLFEIEIQKINKIYKECDVMITHVNPSNEKEYISKQFQNNQSTAYFCFDGEKYLKNGTMKYWIFGHTHDAVEFTKHSVRCICNPLGYPSDNYGLEKTVQTIEI